MKGKFCLSLFIFLFIMTFSGVLLAESVEIIILHTNDTHSRVEAGIYDGMGFARISSLVKEYKEKNNNVLVLDAGDTFHGQTIANLVQGESIARILNQIGYNAMVPGNHDFNYGYERLLELNDITDLPIITANVKKDETTLLEPYIIKEMAEVKVGIFGLSTPETSYKTHPKNVDGLVFANPIETAKKMVEELESKTDIIIALTHLGLSEGSEYTSKMVAEDVEGIDLIVDGHSHDALAKGLKVNNTLIVMAGEYDKNLGVVRLTIEDGKLVDRKASLITKEKAKSTEEDPSVISLIENIKEKNEKITSVFVGETTVLLDGERSRVRTQETNLGNLVTDAILYSVEADCVITNGGGIRASITGGKINKGDVITVLPFGNFVVVKKLTGEAILDAIEHGISAYPATEGIFPQIAGINFVFDPGRPAGERVLDLKVAGKPVDYNKEYLLATNDFIAAGGDGYTMFGDIDTVQEAGSLEEVVINYITAKGVIDSRVEGRILMVEEEGDYYHYTVQGGDVLSVIAGYFEVSTEDIVNLNKIEDSDIIKVGQKILIPIE